MVFFSELLCCGAVNTPLCASIIQAEQFSHRQGIARQNWMGYREQVLEALHSAFLLMSVP